MGHEICTPMPYGSVLVVDDVETNIHVATGLMRPYGLHIESVLSGFEAVDLVARGHIYDIIFMDHMMPDMDGIETAKRLRDMGYNEPIVALTANTVQAEMFLENGFDAFIAKPIDICQLNKVLNDFIRDKQPAEMLARAKRTEAAGKHVDFSGMKVEGMNIAKGLEKFGDAEMYLLILRSYAASARRMLAELESFDPEGMYGYQITTHSLKGTSLDIFATDIGERAALLEEAAKASDVAYIMENNTAFYQDLRKLVDEIDALLASIESSAPPKPQKDKPDKDALERLRAACDMYDMDGADTAMSEINMYQYEDKAGRSLAAWLNEKMDAVDFIGIAERLTAL